MTFKSRHATSNRNILDEKSQGYMYGSSTVKPPPPERNEDGKKTTRQTAKRDPRVAGGADGGCGNSKTTPDRRPSDARPGRWNGVSGGLCRMHSIPATENTMIGCHSHTLQSLMPEDTAVPDPNSLYEPSADDLRLPKLHGVESRPQSGVEGVRGDKTRRLLARVRVWGGRGGAGHGATPPSMMRRRWSRAPPRGGVPQTRSSPPNPAATGWSVCPNRGWDCTADLISRLKITVGKYPSLSQLDQTKNEKKLRI